MQALTGDFFLRFAYSSYLYILLPLLLVCIAVRYFFAKQVVYRYSLGQLLGECQVANSNVRRHLLNLMRFLSLLVLAFLVAKPQLVDYRSKIDADGIDIALVLDVSGSMEMDDFDDGRIRINVAKEEAIRFIQKRQHDAIGLVIFAQDAMSRVPLTLDKQLLINTVKDLSIGVINPDGTKLATAIVTAANRLKHSKAKSKVMILLTDGEPSEDDIDPSVALEIAKKFDIKIYTVGIGRKEPKLVRDFWGRVIRIGVNKELLQKIARETNGQFFMASDVRDMRAIYDTIDQLEKTDLEVPVFSNYFDVFMPFLFFVLALVLLELLLSSWVWFSI